MAKIYISSTFEDLKDERKKAAQAVRRLEHQAVCMEDYVSESRQPLEKCIEDVKQCAAYIGIFAWRYGYIPDGYDKSITHLEYEAARDAGIPCLIFMVDPKARWPRESIASDEELKKIEALRVELQKKYIVSLFSNPDELSDLVTASLKGIDFRTPGLPSTKEISTGSRLGKYVIREKLGKGGKGIVFKVEDTLEENFKAIKMVPSPIADSPVDFKKLKHEVNVASRIIHPNVVKVLGLEEQEGKYFIVMEYIEGRSLEQVLADSDDYKMGETPVLEVMKKLAMGLDGIHKSKVIHRDIKPSNIMVTSDGSVKILDFGISYRVTQSMTELVGEENRTGTLPFMAPEQLSTHYGRENQQADIWGFGATMYRLLSGEYPFKDRQQIIGIKEKPYELEGVSPGIKGIVMKCLEKNREKRFQNMEEVLAALERVGKKKKKEPSSKWNWESIKLGASVLFGVIGLMIFIGLIYLGLKSPKPNPSTPGTNISKIQPEDTTNKSNPAKKPKVEETKTTTDPNTPPIIKKEEQPDGRKPTNDTTKEEQVKTKNREPGNKIEESKKEETKPAPIIDPEIKKLEDDVNALKAKGFTVSVTDSGITEVDIGDGIVLVYIPAGEFTMGSNEGRDDEKPPHRVSLDGYWMGKTEVTVKQFRAFVNATQYKTTAEQRNNSYTWQNPGFNQGDNHPVVNVSWNDAKEYCTWLSNTKGLQLTLPTEAQWEKGARGTDRRKYPWGDHEPFNNGKWYANYDANDRDKKGADGYDYTSPVGSFPLGASPYGLLDMAGNVWEWCSDRYGKEYYKVSPGSNPVGPSTGDYWVLRGGSWLSNDADLRCSARHYLDPGYWDYTYGFRVVRSQLF